ncbi:MAG: I78 family peptidase inhibitor [Roseovarius sp.]
MRIAVISVLVLAGCMPQARDTAAPPPEHDSCGKARYVDLIGEPERNHTFESITPDDGAVLVRIVYPDSAITQDYRAERLNVDVNIDGDIARLWCG